MLIFILKRFGQMLLIMLFVSLLLFLLLEINVESVAVKVLGQYSTEEQRELWLQKHGYYDPVYERYGRWLWGFVTGDLGESVRFKKPINGLHVGAAVEHRRPRVLGDGVSSCRSRWSSESCRG